PAGIAKVAEPTRDHPHPDRNDENSVHEVDRERDHHAGPRGVRCGHAERGLQEPVPERDEQHAGGRDRYHEPPSCVHGVAAGPDEARFNGTDQWLARLADRPAEGTEGRDAPGAHQPGGEGHDHAGGERREHEVADGDLEIWHTLSLARCAGSFSGSARPWCGPGLSSSIMRTTRARCPASPSTRRGPTKSSPSCSTKA